MTSETRGWEGRCERQKQRAAPYLFSSPHLCPPWSSPRVPNHVWAGIYTTTTTPDAAPGALTPGLPHTHTHTYTHMHNAPWLAGSPRYPPSTASSRPGASSAVSSAANTVCSVLAYSGGRGGAGGGAGGGAVAVVGGQHVGEHLRHDN